MNEKIKELILKAGFPKFDKMYVVSDGEELEKFAELIIEECVESCRRANDIRQLVPPTRKEVVSSCIIEIKTTFGS